MVQNLNFFEFQRITCLGLKTLKSRIKIAIFNNFRRIVWFEELVVQNDVKVFYQLIFCKILGIFKDHLLESIRNSWGQDKVMEGHSI